MSKKQNQPLRHEIKLTPLEIKSLNKIRKEYPTSSQFRIIQSSESGIGPGTIVEFTHADNGIGRSLMFNITDVSSW